jgi:hypothetical protein
VRDTSAYRIDGERVPSVTKILELAGLVDLSMIPPDALEHARRRGHEVHEWLELLDQGFIGSDYEPDDWIRGYVEAYVRFKEDSGFAPELIEQIVKNPLYRYVGTLDRTGKLYGRRVLVDLKAVAQVRPETALQTMGYAMCLEEPHERFSLQLRPDGSYRLHRYTNRADHHDWLAAVRIAHWRLRNQGERLGD